MIRPISKKQNFSRFLKAKIVATVGPSSADEATLLRMIKNGMSVARLNFSHGSHEAHLEVIERIRHISKKEGYPVAILQDLCGPKIRLSQMVEPVALKRNQVIKLSVDKSADADLFTDFFELPSVVKKGDAILLDDGYIELIALEVLADHVVCRVKVPGLAKSRKGINLPDMTASIPVFTPKDREDLAFGLEKGVDLVALSFVETRSDIEPIREMIEASRGNPMVIAKIERPAALRNIQGIVKAFDGIMVARGDLGVEMAPEEVPVFQKKLIHLANTENKLVITATQMLESMIGNPRPTRAEASDVANALMDGSDAVMLSGETAAGKYPVKAVNMMKRIALTMENSLLYDYTVQRQKEQISHTEAIAESATKIASDLKAKCIMVYTLSGNTALLLSKFRPPCPILAFSPYMESVWKMAAYWGVSPHCIDFTPYTDEMILLGEEHVKGEKLVKSGDLVITIAGVTRMKGATNMLRISKVT